MKVKYHQNLEVIDGIKHKDESLKQEMQIKLEEKQQQIHVLQVKYWLTLMKSFIA